MFRSGECFTWEMLGWKLLCKVLVSTCSGTSPWVLRMWRARRSSGGPRCRCRILLASAIFFFKRTMKQGRASRNSSALRDSQHFSPDFAKHSQAVPVCKLQPVQELLIETAPDQKPCPAKFIPDLWTANSKEIKNTPNCVRATPIYAGVRGSWPDSCAGRCGHANKVG